MESGTYVIYASITIPLLLAFVLLPTIFKNVFTSRYALNGIPGPFLARFTNLWRLWVVYRGHAEKEILTLHNRYGKTVRLGPNCVSIGDVDTIKKIYTNKGVTKSNMYRPASFVQNRTTVDTIFSVQDEAQHSSMFRPIARLYNMGSVVKHENLIDSALESFFYQLDKRFVESHAVCKMDDWITYFTWDIMAELTFSEKFGFLEHGQDAMGLIRTNSQIVDYFALAAQMPIVDRFLDKNPIVRIGPPSATAAAAFSAERLYKRMAEHAQGKDIQQKDMMDSFIAIKKENPEIPDPLVISWVLMNVLAGADTSSCTLRAAVYYILKNESVYAKLQKELDDANIELPVRWQAIRDLPYLGAVIREAFRIHPAVGIGLERVLPQALTLPDGRSLPPGTIFAIHPWVISRDPAFGEHVDRFIPERWLKKTDETDDEFERRLGVMNAADMTFGFGKRACYGKNIALLEMHKTIAALFATYNMTLEDPDKEWSTRSFFFVSQKGINVRLNRRRD